MKYLLLLLLPTLAFGDISSRLNIEETDGAPSVFPYKLKVSTGTLTDNGDGTATLTTGGGGTSGNFVAKTGDTMSGDLEFTTSLIGAIFTDSASCRWRTTINTTGNLVTSLVSCPSPAAPSNCTGRPVGILLSITRCL